ncbi:MAG: DUF2784 domain-containing protein [Gemmatimonadaceae bacterium]
MISVPRDDRRPLTEPVPDGAVSWRILARGIAGIHIAYVLFVIAGSLLVLISPALMWIHLAAVAWAFATMTFNLGCPLTPWEKQSWLRGGRVPYDEGFLQHHILRSRFDPAHSRRNHIVLGALVLLINLLVYALIFSER